MAFRALPPAMLEALRSRARDRPRATVAVLSVLGYALVIGTFAGVLPVYPDLTNAQVNLFSHAIAGINTTATLLLVLGWKWIREGKVENHRKAMGSAFGLIMVFLVLYLWKIGGGGTKEIVGAPDPVYYAYLLMLAIHIVLSVVAVPVVLYALVLGLTHSPRELREETPHKRVGRVAAGSWILSLSMGVLTYVLLNWVYSYEFTAGTGM